MAQVGKPLSVHGGKMHPLPPAFLSSLTLPLHMHCDLEKHGFSGFSGFFSLLHDRGLVRTYYTCPPCSRHQKDFAVIMMLWYWSLDSGETPSTREELISLVNS